MILNILPYSITFFHIAPGRVSNLMGTPVFTSVELTWGYPDEPNGVIIAYEITYTINGSGVNTTNITNLSTAFTIDSLRPGTSVTRISVTAYTEVGAGAPVALNDIVTLTKPRKFRECKQ